MLNINHQLSPCTTQLAFYNQCFEVLLLLAGTCLFYIVNKFDKEVVFFWFVVNYVKVVRIFVSNEIESEN